MSRPQYPSDRDRKKSRPHVKVHLSLANHPRFESVASDVEMRGMLVGLWMVSARAFAGATDDFVRLSGADLRWITGRDSVRPAALALSKLCAAMGYRVAYVRAADGLHPSRTGAAPELQTPCTQLGDMPEMIRGMVVEVRNFAKKQGWTPQLRSGATHTPHASDSDTEAEAEAEGGSAELAAEETPKTPAPQPPDPPKSRRRAAPRVDAMALPPAGDAIYADLARASPLGKQDPEVVHSWAEMVAPKIRAQGYRDMRRTLANWWKNATRAEIEQALVKLQRDRFAERQRSPPPPIEMTPEMVRDVMAVVGVKIA